MNRKRRKLNPEEREELNKQYITIAELLIKLVGESTQSKILRALLIGGIAAAAQFVASSPEVPEGALPERVETAPASPSTAPTPVPKPK